MRACIAGMMLAGLAVGGGCTVLFPFGPPDDTSLPGAACVPRPPDGLLGTWPDETTQAEVRWADEDPLRGRPFLDLAFGTTPVVRVTHSRSAFHPETGVPSFNADSTRFLVYNDPDHQGEWKPYVYTFEDASGLMIDDGRLAAVGDCNPNELWWSATDPAILYCMAKEPSRIMAIDPVEAREVDEWPFDGALSTEEQDDDLGWLTVSEDGRAVLRTDGSYEIVVVPLDAAHSAANVWPYGDAVDPVPGLDHSGRWLIVESEGDRDLYDLRGDDAVFRRVSGDGYGAAAGDGVLYEPRDGQIFARVLAEPQVPEPVFQHPALLSPSVTSPRGDPSWLLLSLCALEPDIEPRRYDGEILAVATDGSWARRISQMHSVCGEEALDGGRASVSHDGRYALFTREDEEGGTDVYLLELPCE